MDFDLVFGAILGTICVLIFVAALIYKLVDTVKGITAKTNKQESTKEFRNEVDRKKTIGYTYDAIAFDLAQKLGVVDTYQKNRIEMLEHILTLFNQNIRDGETMTAVTLYYISDTNNKVKQLFKKENSELSFSNAKFKNYYEAKAISLMKEFKFQDEPIEQYSEIVVSKIQSNNSAPKENTNEKNDTNAISKWFNAIVELITDEKNAYVNKNKYTILDYLLYEYFNHYVAFCCRSRSPEKSKDFSMSFHKEYCKYATDILKMDKDEAVDFYWDRIEKYGKIMESDTEDKDGALIFNIEQFIKKSLNETPFEKAVVINDVFKSLAIKQEINTLYQEIGNKTLELFLDVCASYGVN